MEPLIRTLNLTKTYHTGELDSPALRGVTLDIQPGEFTALAGPSGSGKTTLLNLFSGLDQPTQGSVFLSGRPIHQMSGAELSDFRRDKIGFVFQSFNLIPVLTAFENVEYMLLLQGVAPQERRDRVMQGLAEVGLAGLEQRFPTQLSGGQQQRVAVARAMITAPDIVLADEPTANLDSAAGSALIELMHQLNRTTGRTFVFSTHDRMIMERAQRLILLKDGQIDQDERR